MAELAFSDSTTRNETCIVHVLEMPLCRDVPGKGLSVYDVLI
jgi:hypothetical protein